MLLPSYSRVSHRHRLGAGASIAALAAAVLFAGPAAAAPAGSEILAGDYLKIGLNNKGTLGVGGTVSPGVLYDGTGTGTFNPAYDYLTPGSPFEGFTISGTGASAFTYTNNNSSLGSAAISGTLTSYNGVAHEGSTYDQRAVWTGGIAGLFNITHDYAFNTNGQQLNIGTTIEALTDLSNLTFSRFIDPDAQAAAGDSSATTNVRGATGVPESDVVYAEALASKYVIGLYTNDATTHNSAITGWTQDTASYLAGTNVGNGDNTIGLGFNIGALLSGSRITLTYRYIFGVDIAAAVAASGGGGGSNPPPPTTIDTSAPYTIEQLKSGSVTPVFDGGTLTLGGSGVLDSNFTILAAGGTVDTAGNDLTLSGALSGPGVLNKVGGGLLTLTGANSFAGVNVSGGGLALSGPEALGGAPVTLSGGGFLQITQTQTLTTPIQILGGQTGGFDTAGHQVTLTGGLGGGGMLVKQGAGTLLLQGANDIAGLNIQGGSVVVSQAGAAGASGGPVIIGGGGAFGVASDMTLTQNFVALGSGGAFNTGGHQVVLTGSISGDACFTKVGEGHLNLVAAGGSAIGACVQEGQLSFNNQFVGNVWVDPGAVLGGSGHVVGDVLAGGILSPGNSPGRLVVSGSVTQTAGSTLLIEIDGPTPGVGAGHYDTVVLTGAGAVFTAAGTLSPVTRGITGAANNTYTPSIGDRFEVVVAEGGVQGAFERLIQPAQGLPDNARFDVVYRPGSIILAVTPDRFARLAGKLNAQAAGAAVDAARPAPAARPAAGVTPLATRLAGLDASQISLALHAASGEAHAVGLDALAATGRHLSAQVQSRLQAPQTDQRLWAQVSGARWEVDGDVHAEGYDGEGVTLVVGADRAFGPNLTAGVAAAYGEATADSGRLGEAKVFTYRGLAYGAWRQEATYVHGLAGASQDQHKIARHVILGDGVEALHAKAGGRSLFADLEAGREIAVAGTRLTLAAGLGAEQVNRDAVRETGGQTALSFADQDREAVQARIGVRLQRTGEMAGWQVSPYGSAFLTQELAEESARIDTALDGAGFQVRAAAPGATGLRIGAGVEARLAERARLAIDYRLAHSDRSQSHGLAATVSLTW